jgi:hypothetical protein
MGTRLGIDRDEDGVLDGLEAAAGSSPHAADTDHDGYADGLELLLGSAPNVHDAFVPGDVRAPAVLLAEARFPFADTATLHALADEPASVLVEVGLAAGSYDLAAFADDELRSAHDVVLSGLPAGTTLHYRVTATDRNENAGTFEGSFETAPPLYHVAEIELQATAGPPFTLAASVRIVDQAGAPVADAPVRGLWAGDIGGLEFFPQERTDLDGVATFVLGPFTPAGPTTVTFSPAHVGSPSPVDSFFSGFGGAVPDFYYNQSANAVNHRAVDLN